MKASVKHITLLLTALAALLATPFYGQEQKQTGSVTGIVLDKDGKTPLVGASIQIDSLARSTDGRIMLLERVITKTLRDGRYRYSGIPAGRIRITVIVNNQPVMSNGGDDIVVLEGRETVADFDLSKSTN